jgi:4-amino-4-deoxy-L-arabinose transferase-like glycosyltransferase
VTTVAPGAPGAVAGDRVAVGRHAAARTGDVRLTVLRKYWHPLIAVCAVQAALSLALVWSNTAYLDEADYLWTGHLVLGHWLHGSSWPSAWASQNLSGSPVIYPPIGAIADSLGGLAGARILSLLFMLGATVLLYRTALRITGRRAALIASVLWALSEPAFRLAYATYDPLSVFLTTVSAWLIVEATYRRHRFVLGFAAAAVLAVANATAYSGIVIDPVVIGFAFLVWLPVMPVRRAFGYASAFAAAVVAFFVIVMVGTGSWAGTGAVFDRQTQDHESLSLVMAEIWGYSGLLIALALIGTLIAFKVEDRQRGLLLAVLGLAVFTAPVAQFHYGTAWSADKHVAYGFWFAAMAAGYGCDKLIGRPAQARAGLIAVACAVALIYPAVYGFQAAWQRYHLWPNSTAFVAALRPVLAHAQGQIYVPGHVTNIAQYYLPQGRDWWRWNAALALDPAGLPVPVPRANWHGYYAKWVRDRRYGVIALFYSTTFTASPALSGRAVVSGGVTGRGLLNLVGANSNEPGIPILTEELEKSRSYKLVASGPYNITNISGTHSYGAFAIWQLVGNRVGNRVGKQ